MAKREFGILVAVILLCLCMFACTQEEEKAPVANSGVVTAGLDATTGDFASVQQSYAAPTSVAPGYIPLVHMTETFARRPC